MSIQSVDKLSEEYKGIENLITALVSTGKHYDLEKIKKAFKL